MKRVLVPFSLGILTALLTVGLINWAAAEETKPDNQPVVVQLSESQLLRLENADLKLSLANQQAQILFDQRARLAGQVCDELKLKDCQFNLQQKTATAAKPPLAEKPQPAETGRTGGPYHGPMPSLGPPTMPIPPKEGK